MNKNIEVINQHLWAVNFDYVNAGWIKEITFKQTDSSAPACFLDSGIILINSKDADYKDIIIWMEKTMQLPTNILGTMKGFYELVRKLIPKVKHYTDAQLKPVADKAQFTSCRKVYQACCDAEKQRRHLQKQHKKDQL